VLDELAGAAAGQVVGEVDAERALVAGDPAPDELHEFGLESGPGLDAAGSLDDGFDLLAHLRVGDADDRDVVHRAPLGLRGR
jgi:hypothetical protein